MGASGSIGKGLAGTATATVSWRPERRCRARPLRVPEVDGQKDRAGERSWREDRRGQSDRHGDRQERELE